MGTIAPPTWSLTRSCATLQARHHNGGALWTLELSGEADLTTLDLLEQEIREMASTGRGDAVVDLSGLAFCDVASAHLLLTAGRENPVTLIGATRTVRRVLDLVEALQVHGLPRNVEARRPAMSSRT